MRHLIAGLLGLTVLSSQPSWKLLYFQEEKIPVAVVSSAIDQSMRATMIREEKKLGEKCWNFPNKHSTQNTYAKAEGKFGKGAVKITAVMTELCYTVEDLQNTIYLVGFFDKDSLKNYFVFQKTKPSFIVAFRDAFGVHDINLNGLDELALVISDADGCCDTTTLYLFENMQTPKCVSSFDVVKRSDLSGFLSITRLFVQKSVRPSYKANTEEIRGETKIVKTNVPVAPRDCSKSITFLR